MGMPIEGDEDGGDKDNECKGLPEGGMHVDKQRKIPHAHGRR